MAYNKTEKPDFPAKRKGGIRRRKKVCVGERQDSAQKNYRKLCEAPESADSSNQTRKTCGTDALCSGLSPAVFFQRISKTAFQRRSGKWLRPFYAQACANEIFLARFLYTVKKWGNETIYRCGAICQKMLYL